MIWLKYKTQEITGEFSWTPTMYRITDILAGTNEDGKQHKKNNGPQVANSVYPVIVGGSRRYTAPTNPT